MTTFMQSIPLALTPLMPIHIGCGQDFEPTNYVIDDGFLYHFDPASLPLSESDRNELMSAVNRPGDEAIRAVQRFFHTRKDRFAGVARGALSVAAGVAEQYLDRIGQVAQHEAGGRRVANQLEIERTAHHPHSGTPYVPGSSIKGAIRTAWLDQLNQGRGKTSDEKAQDIEKRLLDSRAGFHADPFRLLHVADACGPEVNSKIVFATNHKKRLVHDRNGQIVQAKGPSTRREVIVGGQYRALTGEIRLDTLPGVGAHRSAPNPDRRISAFKELAQACNRYYVPRMQAMIKILESRLFAEPGWIRSLQDLLDGLQPHFDSGRLLLLRVGRHSGAENVTLDGVRSIKIMTGRGKPPEWSPEGAKTIWLAAERENDRSGMLPFGWLIVESATAAPLPGLAAWCQAQAEDKLADVRSRLIEARRRAAAEAERLRQLEIDRLAQAEAEAAAQAAREAALAMLSDEGRKVHEFIDSCKEKHESKRRDPLSPGSGLYAEALRLSKSALAEASPWSDKDRAALAAACEQWLPLVVERLDRKDDWKDARKKLKLAALKGE